MQESGAKRPAKLPQRESAEENDRADTLSDACQCQAGEAEGDVPAHQSTTTRPAEVPEVSQDAPLPTNSNMQSLLYPNTCTSRGVGRCGLLPGFVGGLA